MPDALSNKRQIEIRFRQIGPANRFECQLDGAVPVECTSPFVKEAGDGPHTFSVAAAYDESIDPTPASHSWTIDGEPPDTTITGAPAVLDSDLTPILTFTGADPGGGPVTFQCKLDTQPAAPCVSPLQLTVTAGSHTFTVTAIDAAGNADPMPESVSWQVVTEVPDTVITKGPNVAGINGTATTFEFRSNPAGATFECSREAGPFEACSSPVQLTGLSDGQHRFEVRAVSPAGADESPDLRQWQVDAIPPAIQLDATPPDPTNDRARTFAFSSSEGGVTFTCRIDGDTFAACTSPFLPRNLNEGRHTFEVKGTDAVGNSDTLPSSWTLDTVPPVISLGVQPAALSNDSTPSVTFQLDAGATAQCQIDAGGFAPCSDRFDSPAVGDGAHAIVILATDLAGNTAETSIAFAIDTQAPVVTITPPGLTTNRAPTITFAVSETSLLECRIDGGALAPCRSPFRSPLLGDGVHTFEVRATDAATNVGSDSAGFTIDSTAPALAITGAPPAHSNTRVAAVTFTAEADAVTTCQVDGGAPVGCTSPFNTTVGSDGDHEIAVIARDLAGNTASADTRFSVDTIIPTVTITNEPVGATRDNTPSIAFTTTDAPTTVECRVNGGAFAPCGSPFAPGVLADGSTTIVVQVSDLAGNSSSDSATIVVDATPPTVTITGQPAALSNDVDADIAFTTDGATVVQCVVDGGAPVVPCSSPFTAQGLTDGEHTIEVVATDGVGNAASDSATFAIDATPPVLAIDTSPPALSSDTTPVVTFTVTGASSTTCQLDLGVPVACSSSFTATVADGDHAVTIRASDLAGNSAVATTPVFRVDATPPTVAITDQPRSLTNDRTPAITFAVVGDATDTECQVDAGLFADCESPFSPLAALADGSHSVTVRVTDEAGNFTTATTTPFTVDATPPTVTITVEPASPDNLVTPSVTFNTAGSPTRIQCQVDATAFVDCTSPYATPPLGDGGHTVTVRVTDAAGNTGEDSTGAFVVDTAPPAISFDADGQPAALSNEQRPVIKFTAEAGATTTCQLDSGPIESCESPFTATSDVAEGTHRFTVTASDAAGNTASVLSDPFQVDITKPVLVITESPLALSNDDTPTVLFTDGDATTTTCQLDAKPPEDCDATFTAEVDDGAHTFTVRARDGAGNEAVAIVGPFTVDTVAPTVDITVSPASPSNDRTATIEFTTAGDPTEIACKVDNGAFDDCTSPFDTESLLDGEHTVTVKVTDGAGNSSIDSVTFEIDGTPPVLSITLEPLALSNDDTPTIEFDDGDATDATCQLDSELAVDCESPFTVTVGVDDGEHTITVRATDAAGNEAVDITATFTVDTVAPTVDITVSPTSPSNDRTATIEFTTAGDPTEVACKVDNGAFGDCTSPFETESLLDGEHTVTVKVTDGAGNSSIDSVTFEIDGTPPELEITSEPVAVSSDNTPEVVFSVTGATEVTCQVDSDAPVPSCTSPFTPTVSDGTHTITIVAKDAATNTTTRQTAPFTVDTSAPDAAILLDPDTISADTTPEVTFTVTEAVAGTAVTTTCTVLSNGIPVEAVTPCASPFTAQPLADGFYKIEVTAKDAANNTDSDTTLEFTIDTRQPAVTIVSGPTGPTGLNPILIGFQATDFDETTCSVDGGAPTTCATPFDVGALGDGVHSVAVRAFTLAGNEATAAVSFVVDPTVQCLVDTDSGESIVTAVVEELGPSTIELWFRSSTITEALDAIVPTDFGIFDLHASIPASDDPHVSLFHEGTKLVLVVASDTAVLSRAELEDPQDFSLTDWHHYAVVFTGGEQQLFLDGVPHALTMVTGDGSQTPSSALGGLLPGTEVVLSLARTDSANVPTAVGGLLDVRISGFPRYTEPFRPGFPAAVDDDTVILMPLDEGAGTSSFDSADTEAPIRELVWTSDRWERCFPPAFPPE